MGVRTSAKEIMEHLDDEFARLVANFCIHEPVEGYGCISLELGEREGLKTGYPRLALHRLLGLEEVVWDVAIPHEWDSGYERSRPFTLDEMVLFVLVAKHVAPESFLTRLLVDKVQEFLSAERANYLAAAEKIGVSPD